MRRSKEPRTQVALNTWPRGWTADDDRKDEISDLNTLAILHRAGRQQHG